MLLDLRQGLRASLGGLSHSVRLDARNMGDRLVGSLQLFRQFRVESPRVGDGANSTGARLYTFFYCIPWTFIAFLERNENENAQEKCYSGTGAKDS
jgi:hypothetical protein